MKTKTAKLLVYLTLALMFAASITMLVKGTGERIWTDQENYYPGDTVPIHGSGFAPNAYFAIPLIRPDGSIVLGDGSFTLGWDTVQADATGQFTYNYRLDGINGLYDVRVYDSGWTGDLGIPPLANTTFFDAPPAANLDQVRNGAFDSPISPSDWVNGNVGSQTGHYVEGYSIPYRAVMTDLPATSTIMLTLEYDIKHSGKNAIDYLTNYSRINYPAHQLVFGHPPEVIDPLIGVTGVTGPNSSFVIPAPSSAGSPVPGQPTNSYNNLVGNETLNGVRMYLFGGTITSIVYNIQGDLSVADSSTSVNVTFTTGSATEVLAWGGHIASREDWGFTNGVPNSAGGISGSPYHMRLLDWHLIPIPEKSKDDLPNLGNQDRSLSAVAVFAPVAHPNIALTKTPSSTKVENGTSVTYTYNVTNTGDVSLNVSLVDDHFGTIFTNLTLGVGESNITTITRVLTVNTTNVANATGVYPLTSASVNATATATVTVIHPSIALTKVASDSKVENGTMVTYTYNVTNTGDTALTVSLVDDTFGTLFTGKVLAPGASNITTVVSTLTSSTTNTATATGVDQLGTSVNANATATVTVLHPNIALTKTPSSTKVENGTSVTYTFNVTNTGDTSLTVSLTDSVFGTLFTGKVLAPGASNITTVVSTLTANTTNTATATGVDQLGTSVQAQASAFVRVLHPALTLTKTPDSTKVENGTMVTYAYNVTNTGDVALTVGISDDQFGSIASGQSLAVGESKIFNKTVTLTQNMTNTATATGVDQEGGQATAQDSAYVRVLHPSIDLTKVPSETKVENGTMVTYTYNVTNNGDVALTGNVTDNMFGLIGTFTNLQSGDFMTYTSDQILTVNTTNTAMAIGVDQLGATAADEASAYVRVLHPTIDLTKVASETKVENGTTVTYAYNVTNTGDVALTGNVTDDVFGLIGAFTNLQSGSFVTFTSPQVLTANTTNTATVIGVDQLGATATDQASAYVRVLHPSIDLTKVASDSKVENGTMVTYTYNVTNTGDVALTGNVTDDVFGLIGAFTNLQSGEFITYTSDQVLTANTTNTATAIGVDQLGATATDQASAFVHVIHPDISLTKTASSAKVENGTSVTYTYNVTNTGDTPLTVQLIDSEFGTIFTGKVLAAGASNITTITKILTTNTTNSATATGVDQLGAIVSATKTASVTVIHPAISLSKSANPTKVENGASVTYTYNVTNIGDTSLTVELTDDVFASPIFTGKVLAPGESNITIISHTLTQNTTNTATATGVDQAGATVTAQSTAFVHVIHPAVSLTKTPSSTKVENGATVTYTYNATNIGDVTLTGNITDDVFGTIAFFTLPPNTWIAVSVPQVLIVNTTNTATAFGIDQLGTEVNATASATVTVLHPEITLTKTPSASKVVTGTNVTYTFNVTNLGDTTLVGVNITDNVLGIIATNQILTPGQLLQFTKEATLTTDTANTATASGVDQLGTNVTATASTFVRVIHPAISVDKTCAPDNQLAPGNITWTIVVKNIGDVTLTNVNITESRQTLSNFTGFTLVPNQTLTIIFFEFNLPPGTYYNNATATGAFQLGTVSAWDDATCVVKPVFVLKQFTGVTVLPDGLAQGFNATLVSPTQVNVTGLKSGPYIYFNITYYFENSLNFLGDNFDGQAHNFTLWDKWGGNLMALGSPPISFDPTKGVNNLTLADGSYFRIDPGLTGPHTYRGYIGKGLDISNLASQGQAFITMHLGDQQNTTNPGNGKGTSKDGSSYDTDTVWYIGELGVNESATLTLFIAPGKNPGGQLQFSSPGCTVINTGPRVRAYGNTYNNEDFLYAVDRTNTLKVCVSPK